VNVARKAARAAASPSAAIRPMAPGDAPMAAWLAATALEGMSEGAWRHLLKDAARRAWVAELDGRVVGIVAVAVAADVVEIEHLAVAPETRRQGIGTGLVAHVLNAAAARDATEVRLDVRRTNRAGRRLYGRLGFVEVGVRPGYYRAPADDALLLTRRL
jgi:[ribosomal protein S18]-alanine N-acetyltransferase